MPSAKKPTFSPSVKKTASTSNSIIPFSMIVRSGQQFYIAMPYSSTLVIFFFDEKKITDFLDWFSDLCKDYILINDKKMK